MSCETVKWQNKIMVAMVVSRLLPSIHLLLAFLCCHVGPGCTTSHYCGGLLTGLSLPRWLTLNTETGSFHCRTSQTRSLLCTQPSHSPQRRGHSHHSGLQGPMPSALPPPRCGSLVSSPVFSLVAPSHALCCSSSLLGVLCPCVPSAHYVYSQVPGGSRLFLHLLEIFT